jgi:hypothetical protein
VLVTGGRAQNGLGTIHVLTSSSFSFQLPGLMHLPLTGWTMRTTARRRCLPPREFPVLEENLMCGTLTLVRRFPNPIPAGTLLPSGHFSTSRPVAKAFFSAYILRQRSRMRTIGTSTNRMPSVVRILSLVSLPSSLPHTCILLL